MPSSLMRKVKVRHLSAIHLPALVIYDQPHDASTMHGNMKVQHLEVHRWIIESHIYAAKRAPQQAGLTVPYPADCPLSVPHSTEDVSSFCALNFRFWWRISDAQDLCSGFFLIENCENRFHCNERSWALCCTPHSSCFSSSACLDWHWDSFR